MSSITYNEIYSRFLGKASAYDLIMSYISQETQKDFMCSWFHSAISNPQIRRIFASASLDDDEEIFTYTIKKSVDEAYDKEFVTEVCAQGLLVAWIKPKVYNIINMEFLVSDADKKFLSQANHSAEMRQIQETAEITLTDLLSRSGAYWNDYLDGNTAASSLRNSS